jgi:hypothetical protein
MTPIVNEDKLKRFWLLIDNVPEDLKNEEDNDYDLYNDFLKRVLSKGQKDDLINFHKCVMYLKEQLLNSNIDWDSITYGLSDDGLDYFLYWVISRGSSVYNGLFNDIGILNKAINQVVNTEYEGISYVAYQLWEKKYGSEPMPGL